MHKQTVLLYHWSRFQTLSLVNVHKTGADIFQNLPSILTAGECLVQTCSQQQEIVRNFQVRSERAGGRTWHVNSTAEILVFDRGICLYSQKVSNLVVFLTWHLQQHLLCLWLLFFILIYFLFFFFFKVCVQHVTNVIDAPTYSLWIFRTVSCLCVHS